MILLPDTKMECLKLFLCSYDGLLLLFSFSSFCLVIRVFGLTSLKRPMV